MKRKPSGKISFEEFLTILSKVSRGSVEEKLQWVFGLYDLDGDGLISKEEMLDVVGSIYEMLGRYTQPQILEPHAAAREHVDRIFHLMDANKDGVVTIEELVQWCSKDEQLLRSLDTLDTVLWNLNVLSKIIRLSISLWAMTIKYRKSFYRSPFVSQIKGIRKFLI